MKPEQALSILLQIVTNARFTLAEGDQVKEAIRVLSEAIKPQCDGSGQTP